MRRRGRDLGRLVVDEDGFGAGDAEVAQWRGRSRSGLTVPASHEARTASTSPSSPSAGITPAASAEAFVTIASRAPARRSRPSVGTTSGYRRTPRRQLARSAAASSASRSSVSRSDPTPPAVARTAARSPSSDPCWPRIRASCVAVHADCAAARGTPTRSAIASRPAVSAAQSGSTGSRRGRGEPRRHEPSPTGRSTDAQASADS